MKTASVWIADIESDTGKSGEILQGQDGGHRGAPPEHRKECRPDSGAERRGESIKIYLDMLDLINFLMNII